METLIELYDERAIENILAPDMFHPQRIIYLCPGEIAQDRKRQEKLKAFFRRRGWTPELVFMETSLFKADRILRQLLAIGEKYPDCALDVTGGSDVCRGYVHCSDRRPCIHLLPKKESFLRHFGRRFCR